MVLIKTAVNSKQTKKLTEKRKKITHSNILQSALNTTLYMREEEGKNKEKLPAKEQVSSRIINIDFANKRKGEKCEQETDIKMEV